MKRNILCGVIGFFLGSTWLLIAWVILASVEMFSSPPADESFFKKIESEPFSKVEIIYRKKNLRTGEVLSVRFTVRDEFVLKKLQGTLKPWKFTQIFRTVEFEPTVRIHTPDSASPWKICFERSIGELFLCRNGKYCIASVCGNSFYNEVLKLVEENEKRMSQGAFRAEL